MDTEITGASGTTSWTQLENTTIDGISICSQGAGEEQCIGRNYQVQSVHSKGFLQLAAGESETAPVNDILVRVVWFVDTQANGAIPTAGEWTSIAQSVDVLGFRNLENTKRFRFLQDQLYVVSPHNMNEGAANLFAQGVKIVPIEFNHKFKTPLMVQRSGTTQVVGSIADNVVHCWFICNEGGQVSASVQHRCRFTG